MLGLAVGLDLQIAVETFGVEGPVSALDPARRCVERSTRLRLSGPATHAGIFVARGLFWAGEVQASYALFDELARTVPDPTYVGSSRAAIEGFAAWLAHDPRGALDGLGACVAELRESAVTNPAPVWGQWALLATVVDPDDPRPLTELRNADVLVQAANRAAVHYAEAVLARRDGRTDVAADLTARGDAALGRRVHSRLMLRCLMLGADDAPEPLLREVIAHAEPRGEVQLTRWCRERLRRAGRPVPRPNRDAVAVPERLRAHGVTGRELEVVRLVARGWSNADVAAHLHLSVRTVETHVSNLLAKSGAADRNGLTAWLRDRRRAGSVVATDPRRSARPQAGRHDNSDDPARDRRLARPRPAGLHGERDLRRLRPPRRPRRAQPRGGHRTPRLPRTRARGLVRDRPVAARDVLRPAVGRSTRRSPTATSSHCTRRCAASTPAGTPSTHPTDRSSSTGRRPGARSPPPSRTGSAWPTAGSSSTGPTATTSASRCSSASWAHTACAGAVATAPAHQRQRRWRTMSFAASMCSMWPAATRSPTPSGGGRIRSDSPHTTVTGTSTPVQQGRRVDRLRVAVVSSVPSRVASALSTPSSRLYRSRSSTSWRVTSDSSANSRPSSGLSSRRDVAAANPRRYSASTSLAVARRARAASATPPGPVPPSPRPRRPPRRASAPPGAPARCPARRGTRRRRPASVVQRAVADVLGRRAVPRQVERVHGASARQRLLHEQPRVLVAAEAVHQHHGLAAGVRRASGTRSSARRPRRVRLRALVLRPAPRTRSRPAPPRPPRRSRRRAPRSGDHREHGPDRQLGARLGDDPPQQARRPATPACPAILSVSMSARSSPLAIVSPSATNHSVILPVFIDRPHLGIVDRAGSAHRSALPVHHRLDRVDDLRRVRDVQVLQRVGERHRRVRRRDQLDRRPQRAERLLRDQRPRCRWRASSAGTPRPPRPAARCSPPSPGSCRCPAGWSCAGR